MSTTIQVVFENGVFRPKAPVDLPERSEFEIDLRPSGSQVGGEPAVEPNWDELYALLGRGVATGDPKLAARHDEHQP